MNLFLYLPSHSAHPPGTLKGLVFGSFNRYWKQNSLTKDFIKVARKLYVNLKRRGYEEEKLQKVFIEAAQAIDKKQKDKAKTRRKLTIKNSLFFHREFHQDDLSRRELQQEIQNHFNVNKDVSLKELDMQGTTIAYSRPKNIKDILCPTTLHQTKNNNTRTHLKNLKAP